MFDPDRETAEACSDFLFRWNARRLLARWWAARSRPSVPRASLRFLAEQVIATLTVPEPYPNGRPRLCAYALRQLGDPMRVAGPTCLGADAILRHARADLAGEPQEAAQ